MSEGGREVGSAVQFTLRASQAGPVPHREQNSAMGVVGAPMEFSILGRGKNGTTLQSNLDRRGKSVKGTQVHRVLQVQFARVFPEEDEF
jgi:hypothetical protein